MPPRKRKTPTKKVAAASKQAARVSLDSLLGGGSGLLARSRIASLAGLQFGGKRDLYAVAGYVPDGDVRFLHYWSLYKRGEIAGRIVDMPAKTTWRTPPEVIEEERPDGTAFTEAVVKLAKRLQLWNRFERVDRLAGIGRYAVLVLGTRGTTDQQLATPLARLSKPEDLLYVGVYHEDHAKIAEWVTDPGDERFGLPKTYTIQLSSGVEGFGKASATVHASRLVHVAEDCVQDNVYGRPRLERALNRLFDLDKIAASCGESFYQSATRILQAKIDPEATITPDQQQELKDAMAEMVHDLRRQFFGQGTELSWLPNDTRTPKDVGDFYFALVSAACGIPRRILFGNEAGELASTTDQATYFGMINERQEQFAEPTIARAFFDTLIKYGALPEPETGEYQILWPPLFEKSADEEAAANLKRAQTAQALTAMGADPLALVEIDEDRNVWLVPREPAPEERPLLPTQIPTPPEGAPTGADVPLAGGQGGGAAEGQPAAGATE